jgi:hypothetical protein
MDYTATQMCDKSGRWMRVWLTSAILCPLALGSLMAPPSCAAADEKAAAKRDAVVLRPSSGADGGDAAWESLLAREIARQALLNAARDQLGLPTRDLLLREGDRKAAEEAGRLVDVRVSPVRGSKTTVLVRGIQGNGRKKLAEEKMPCPDIEPMPYKPYLDFADKLERKQYVDALKKAGFAGEPTKTVDHGTVPAEIEKLVARMSFPAQFAAVRQLHALARKEGYSPEVTGALVRAYANLSMFTEVHWSSSHQIFKARALLYAHRMKMAGDGPWARWHRAYAWAIAGVHVEAIHDLDAADKMIAQGKPTAAAKEAKAPAWVALIKAACRFETDKKTYMPAEGAPERELAIVLAARNTEINKVTPDNEPSLFNPISHEKTLSYAAALPHCCRLDDSVHATTSSDTHVEISNRARRKIAEWLYKEMALVPDLPKSVAEIVAAQQKRDSTDAVQEFRTRADLLRALYGAGAADTTGEPSWSVLAMLVEDVTFTWGQCEIGETDKLDENAVGDLLELYEGMLTKHPFREMLQLHNITDWQLHRESYRNVLDTIDVSNLPYLGKHIYRGFPDNEIIKKFELAGYRHLDDTYAGLVQGVRLTNPEFRLRLANQLYAISPYSPLSVAKKVELDWKNVKQNAVEWETRYSGDLAVMRAMGIAHFAEGDNAGAIRCMKRYLDYIHEFAGYKLVAEAHRRMHDPNGMVAVWKQACEVTGHPPSLAACRNEFIRGLTDLGKYREAIAAADAMQNAGLDMLSLTAEAAEYAQDFDESEKRYKQLAEAMPARLPAALWYVFNLRTGKGDADASKQAAEAFIAACESEDQRLGDEEYSAAGRLALAMGNPERAAPLLAKAQESHPRPIDAWHVMLRAVETSDKESASAIYDTLKKNAAAALQNSPIGPAGLNVAEHWIKAEKAGKDLDAALIEKLLKATGADERVRMCYFVGRCYELRGVKDRAKTWYTASVSVPRGCVERTVAAMKLREMGVEPNDVKITAWPPLEDSAAK